MRPYNNPKMGDARFRSQTPVGVHCMRPPRKMSHPMRPYNNPKMGDAMHDLRHYQPTSNRLAAIQNKEIPCAIPSCLYCGFLHALIQHN